MIAIPHCKEQNALLLVNTVFLYEMEWFCQCFQRLHHLGLDFRFRQVVARQVTAVKHQIEIIQPG